jgi:hypothetical protein
MFNPVRPSIAVAVAAVVALAAPAAAQNESALRSYFEGRRVTVRIDMPGTSSGIDVRADGRATIDYQRYRDNLKRFGTSIRAGDSVVVTLVKVKKDLIEFQLGGGGFGTFGDDSSTSVYIPLVDKSQREKDLERRVRDEYDRDRKRKLQRELDDLRERRERENRRIMIERERAEAHKRDEVADRRMQGGSRFNLRYQGSVPAGIRPEDLKDALAEFVDFRTNAAPSFPPPPPPRSAQAGDVSLLHKGMLRAEAEREFGRPVQSSDRRDGGIVVRTLVFDVGDQRVTADFIEDVLVRYTIASK